MRSAPPIYRLEISVNVNYLETMGRYRKAYKNRIKVLYRVRNKNFPFYAELRNKSSSKSQSLIENGEQASLISLGMDVDFDSKQECLVFKNQGKQIYMKGADFGHGDIRSVFFYENYNSQIQEGQTVIDIGANIEDSAFHFAANGMSLVVNEPYPKNANLAFINADLNGFADKITVFNAALGATNGRIKIDANSFPDIGSDFKPIDKGAEIPMLTFDEILMKSGIREAFLKMNCEGCEYDGLLKSSDQTILKFKKIALEYHYGPKNLVERLKNLGYYVEFTKPRTTHNKFTRVRNLKEGYIYASRKDE